jgi:hypothetical protein
LAAVEPVTLSIVLAVICVAAVSFTVWTRRFCPGHERRSLAVMLGVGELVAGTVLLLSGDVGNVQLAVGGAFVAAGLLELGDAAKRSVDADPEASEAAGKDREQRERFQRWLREDSGR